MENQGHGIFYTPNTQTGKATCTISEVEFEIGWPFAYCINGDPKLPVSPQYALDHGFTMRMDDYKEMRNCLCEGLRKRLAEGK